MKMNAKRNWRIFALGLVVALSLALVVSKGLSFGIDFTGGTELKMKLEEGGEEHIDAVVDILKNRLNSMGLKSTQVLKEADGKHIAVKVSTTDAQELASVKDVIKQQAVFEQMVEGELCSRGDEIQLDLSKQGGVYISGRQWRVYVKTTGEGPERSGAVMEGKAGRMTDIFLDRPKGAFMLLESGVCRELAGKPFSNHLDDAGYTMLSFLEERALLPVVCYTTEKAPEANETVNETLLAELGLEVEKNETETLDLEEAVREMRRLSGEGVGTVITMVPPEQLPPELRDETAALNLTVRIFEKSESEPFHDEDEPDSWIDRVTGLKSTLRIGEGLTYGSPVYSSVFEGSGRTSADAKQTAENFKIWLTSGNLPVKTSIVLERPNLPELGQEFLKYVGLIALAALGLVAAVVSLRYRNPRIWVFILLTSFSEIIIIMGFASLSSWELDLAAMAGIIAAIGTGVDHQIIITDETLRGERRSKESKIWDIKQSINRAFFIIFTSAATTVCAMLPLMSIIDLRGFAFTSIVGVLIGILITRPAYARIIELIT